MQWRVARDGPVNDGDQHLMTSANQQWIERLGGGDAARDAALADLRQLLLGRLGNSFRDRADLGAKGEICYLARVWVHVVRAWRIAFSCSAINGSNCSGSF